MSDLLTLGFLVLLQAVLGFDNLLYVSLESKRVPPERQQFVRRLGIGLAIVLRIALLFLVLHLVESFRAPVFGLHVEGFVEGEFNLHACIVLAGGAFILYTATKEILHMLRLESAGGPDAAAERSVPSTVFWIVLMNLVFSFDSILSAMALTKVFWIMATAVVISGALMMWLSDSVSRFLQRNRMYEVLGLFILFVVGIMLLTEGGHLAHLTLFGNEITPMTKTTFYFVIAILIVTDVVQTRYQRKLMASGQAPPNRNIGV
ncbi:MAG: TerC family protein [Planctomycetota bacterium]